MKFIDNAIEMFENRKPMAVMARVLITSVVSARMLDSIFAENRIRQFEGILSFSTVADMMGEVALKIHPAINASYGDRTLEVSVKSVYNKLNGIETQVSRAVLKETAANMLQVAKELGGVEPPLVEGYRVKIVDGNHLRRTDSRLGALRECNVAPLPGQALVVYDPQFRLAIDVLPCECGHASERSLFPDLLETIVRNDLVVADRHFCTLGFLFGVAAVGGKFAIRQHGNLPFTLKGRRRRVGEIETGVVYEQTMQCADDSGCVRNFRRITVHLYEPTRDGDVEIHVITNLPKRIGAIRIAELYRKRWQIETAFQNVAENFAGEIETLGYPKAALFSFCMALVSYNLFSTIRCAVGSVHGEEAAANLSIYYVTNEIASAADGMSVVIDDASWREKYGSLTTKQIAAELKRIAEQINLKKYKKNKWTPKNKDRPKKDKTNRQHASTYKILQAAQAAA